MAFLYKSRSRRGFTLVELVVSIAIFAILTTGISTVLVPSLSFFSSSLRWSSDKSASNTIYHFLNESLKYASEVRYYENYSDGGISGLSFSSDYTVLKIDNSATDKGQLYTCPGDQIGHLSFTPIYNSGYYGGRNFVYDISVSSGTVSITIDVYYQNNPTVRTHTLKNTFGCANLKKAEKMTGSGANQYIIFKNPTETDINKVIADAYGGDGGSVPVSPPPVSTDSDSDSDSESLPPVTPFAVQTMTGYTKYGKTQITDNGDGTATVKALAEDSCKFLGWYTADSDSAPKWSNPHANDSDFTFTPTEGITIYAKFALDIDENSDPFKTVSSYRIQGEHAFMLENWRVLDGDQEYSGTFPIKAKDCDNGAFALASNKENELNLKFVAYSPTPKTYRFDFKIGSSNNKKYEIYLLNDDGNVCGSKKTGTTSLGWQTVSFTAAGLNQGIYTIVVKTVDGTYNVALDYIEVSRSDITTTPATTTTSSATTVPIVTPPPVVTTKTNTLRIEAENYNKDLVVNNDFNLKTDGVSVYSKEDVNFGYATSPEGNTKWLQVDGGKIREVLYQFTVPNQSGVKYNFYLNSAKGGYSRDIKFKIYQKNASGTYTINGEKYNRLYNIKNFFTHDRFDQGAELALENIMLNPGETYYLALYGAEWAGFDYIEIVSSLPVFDAQ